MSEHTHAVSAFSRPRLLVVSATYGTEENRKKLIALSRHFRVTCATCAEHTQYGLANRIDPERPPAEYRLCGLPAQGDPTSTTRYYLKGLDRVFRENPADIVLVESEPWAWIRWQAWFCKTLYCPRAIFGEFSAENLRRTGLKGVALGLFYRTAVLTADFVVHSSRAGGQIYRSYGVKPARLLVTSQLGVDDRLFHPAEPATRSRLREESGIAPGCFLIGFCGRLVEAKGILDLLAAVRLARAQLPETNVHLSILGAGPLREQLLAEEGAGEYLHLLPPRMHEGVAPYMQMLDLFVLPSKAQVGGPDPWIEQFGFVLIQAMACAVPTVGSDCGAIPEVIDLPRMIFPAGNVAALHAKLMELIGDPASRGDAARQQLEQTLDRYSNDNLAATWADFMRRQLPGHQDAPAPAPSISR
jgi:glycosyltransferase involved in cell wall biosynthesis